MAIKDYLTMKGVKKAVVSGLAGVVLSGAVCAGSVGNAYANDRLNHFMTNVTNHAEREVGREIGKRLVDMASEEEDNNSPSYQNSSVPTIAAYRWEDIDGDGDVTRNEVFERIDGPLDTSKYGIKFRLENNDSVIDKFNMYDNSNESPIFQNYSTEIGLVKRGQKLPDKITVRARTNDSQFYHKVFNTKQN